MRRVTCAVVLLLALSSMLSASSLSGRWKTRFILNVDETIAFSESIQLSSELAAELHLDGWTFANVTSFASNVEGLNVEGLNKVKFAAAGPFGAFDVVSSMTFDEGEGDFSSVAAARTSIGGLSLWSGAILSGVDPPFGMGFLVGASGIAGNVEFYTDIAFNMGRLLSQYIIREGFDAVWRQLMLCDLLSPAAYTCELSFSYFNMYTKVPLGCFDVETLTIFVCSESFRSPYFDVWISDVDLGLEGLTLDRFEILFLVDRMQLFAFDLGLRLAETVCITPYVTLVRDVPLGLEGLIDGLSVDALELICTFGNITVVASEWLNTDPSMPGPAGLRPMYVLGSDARIHRIGPGLESLCEVFPDRNLMDGDANEAIGIEVDLSGCCGTTFRLGIYTFFDTDLPESSLFDWSETHVTVDYETAPNLTVSGYVKASHEQAASLGIVFELFWGDLVIFGPKWEDACCRYLGVS